MPVTVTIPGNVPSMAALAYSVFVAVVYGYANYIDSVKTKGEVFNQVMFLKTLVISVIVGFIMAYMGIDPVSGYAPMAVYVTGNAYLMQFTDNVVNQLLGLSGSPTAPTLPK